MFGSKTRKIRDLQELLDVAGERLLAALGDVQTWRTNYHRLERRTEGLETANTALQSMLGALRREREQSTAEPTSAAASDEPLERDLTGVALRPKGQPLDLADELKRAQAHAAALEQRLADLQEAGESYYAGLAKRAGTVPSPSAAEAWERLEVR